MYKLFKAKQGALGGGTLIGTGLATVIMTIVVALVMNRVGLFTVETVGDAMPTENFDSTANQTLEDMQDNEQQVFNLTNILIIIFVIAGVLQILAGIAMLFR